MRILGETDSVIAGFKNISERTGNIWAWWNQGKPIFDAFDEYDPELIMTRSKPRGLDKCLQEKQIPWVEFTDSEIVIHERLDVFRKKIDPLVDNLLFYPTEEELLFRSDIAYIGPVNTTMIKMCLPICRYMIKIAGPQHWPVVQYIGDVNPDQARTLYNSTKIAYAETIEDAIKAAACKTIFVTTNKEIVKFMPEASALFADSFEKLTSVISKYLSDSEKKTETAETLYNVVVPMFTHANELWRIFYEINEDTNAKAVLEYLDEHIK